MRYFVYQDAQIMGPFTREDLSQVHGLHRDSLVCSEASMGTRDSEWTSAAEVSELSGFFQGGPGLAAAPVMEVSSGAPPDHYLRASEESRSLFGGFGTVGEWTSGVFEDPDFFRQWGALVDSASVRGEELELARLKSEALEKNLEDMTRKLAKYERQQNEILERLNLKDRALEEKEKAVHALEARLPELERSLDAARDELRQAKDRLLAFQRLTAEGAAGAPALSPLPARPEPVSWDASPVLEPPPATRPPPAAPPEPKPLEVAPPAAAAPAFEAEIVFEETEPQAPAKAPQSPAAGVEKAGAARFDLPPVIRLQTSTLRATALTFEPPIPGVPPEAAPPGGGLEALPDFFPQAAAKPPRPAPSAAPAPAPKTPPPAAIAGEPLVAPPAEPQAKQAIPSAALAAEEPPPPVPTPALQPVEAAPLAELPANWAADPLALAAAAPGAPSSTVPEAEPLVYSPEPAQPPETLVQRRTQPPAPSPFQDLAAGPGEPWGSPVPTSDPALDLAAIPPPEPMPAAFGVPAATPAPLVELVLAPPPLPAEADPIQLPRQVPEATAPATLEPVGPLQTPRTTIRSLGGPAPGLPQTPSKALFPDMATPAPVVAGAPAAKGGKDAKPSSPPPTTEGGLPGPETRQRRRQSKTYLLVLGGAFAGLLTAGVFFLKDPKEVIKLFTMSPEKSRPVDPEQMVGNIKPASLSEVKPLPAESQGGPAPTPAAAPNAQPPAATGGKVPPGRDFIADSSLAAIDFAKKHPVGKSRKGVADWLHAKLVKRGDEEEWSAGAVEANLYVVSYRYFKGGRVAKQEPVTYLFEVDLDKKALKPHNPLARELLGGGPAGKAAVKPAKRARKSRPAASEEEPKTPGAAEEPAPLDDLLGPPGPDSSGSALDAAGE